MGEDQSKWKSKEKADLMIGFSYMCFGLAGLLLVSDLFSLFVTGEFRLKRFVVDISFIGWGMLGRYFAAHYRRGSSSKYVPNNAAADGRLTSRLRLTTVR